MATVVTKKLRLDENNIKNYCEAQNVSFSVAGHAWRKWLNGSSDGYIILKDNGKTELFPTSTAHPFKADSTISASRSAGTCIVDLQFAKTKVHEESFTSTSHHSKTKENITDSAITNSTQATEIKWHVHGKNGDNQRGEFLELTLYFNQYSAQASIGDGANGIQSVSVSNLAPYYGDTVTFDVKLAQGATFDGWYSDSACSQLVSTDVSYSVSPTADIALYAKATTNATLYNVSAVAGSEIASVTVSDSIVPEGGSVTFTAQVNTGCSFEAWYSDNTYTTVVSTENPHITTITADTILYAKATRKQLDIVVGPAEHGIASVSATTVPYGSDVTFAFVPEDETWELYGWYSDSALTQLVSEANPYTFAVTKDVTLYPKVGKKRYTITLTSPGTFLRNSATTISIIAADTNQLTKKDMRNLRAGEFSSIPYEKVIATDTLSKSYTQTYSVTITTTIGSTVALYAESVSTILTYTTVYFLKDDERITNGPHLVITATENATYETCALSSLPAKCVCTAIALDGIEYAEAYPKTVEQEYTAAFTADILPGYKFKGWYLDEACTKFISSSNPYEAAGPKYTTENESSTSLTLYAKAIKSEAPSGIHLKQNGAYAQAKAIWKKTNGIWAKTDKTAIDTTKNYRLIH